MELTSNI